MIAMMFGRLFYCLSKSETRAALPLCLLVISALVSLGQCQEIDVEPGVPYILEKPSNTTVMMGSRVQLRCQTEDYSKEISQRWLKGSQDIRNSNAFTTNRASFGVKGDLIINAAVKTDRGWYTCRPSNIMGEVEASAYVDVVYKPEVLPMPSPITWARGYVQYLHCPTDANPPISNVSWVKDNSHVPTTGRFDILLNGTLRVSEVQSSDAGNYKCRPYSDLGWGVSSPRVRVEVKGSTVRGADPPSFISRPNPEYIKLVGDSVTMPCRGEGTPAVTTTWKKVSGPFSPADPRIFMTDSALEIRNLDKEDHGRYECIAANTIATIIAVTMLKVNNTTPHAPHNLSVTPGHFNVTVTWEPAYDGGMRQKYELWFRVHKDNGPLNEWQDIPVPSALSDSMVLHGLQPFELYEFKIRAFNKHGFVESEVVTVKTLDYADDPQVVNYLPRWANGTEYIPLITKSLGTQPAPPINLRAEVEGHDIVLSWTAPRQSPVPIFSYKIGYLGPSKYQQYHPGIIPSPLTSARLTDMPQGGYDLSVRSQGTLAASSPSDWVKVNVPGDEDSGFSLPTPLLGGVIGGVVFLVLAIMLALCAVWHSRRQETKDRYNDVNYKKPEEMNGNGNHHAAQRDRWATPHGGGSVRINNSDSLFFLPQSRHLDVAGDMAAVADPWHRAQGQQQQQQQLQQLQLQQPAQGQGWRGDNPGRYVPFLGGDSSALVQNNHHTQHRDSRVATATPLDYTDGSGQVTLRGTHARGRQHADRNLTWPEQNFPAANSNFLSNSIPGEQYLPRQSRGFDDGRFQGDPPRYHRTPVGVQGDYQTMSREPMSQRDPPLPVRDYVNSSSLHSRPPLTKPGPHPSRWTYTPALPRPKEAAYGVPLTPQPSCADDDVFTLPPRQPRPQVLPRHSSLRPSRTTYLTDSPTIPGLADISSVLYPGTPQPSSHPPTPRQLTSPLPPSSTPSSSTQQHPSRQPSDFSNGSYPRRQSQPNLPSDSGSSGPLGYTREDLYGTVGRLRGSGNHAPYHQRTKPPFNPHDNIPDNFNSQPRGRSRPPRHANNHNHPGNNRSSRPHSQEDPRSTSSGYASSHLSQSARSHSELSRSHSGDLITPQDSLQRDPKRSHGQFMSRSIPELSTKPPVDHRYDTSVPQNGFSSLNRNRDYIVNHTTDGRDHSNQWRPPPGFPPSMISSDLNPDHMRRDVSTDENYEFDHAPSLERDILADLRSYSHLMGKSGAQASLQDVQRFDRLRQELKQYRQLQGSNPNTNFRPPPTATTALPLGDHGEHLWPMDSDML